MPQTVTLPGIPQEIFPLNLGANTFGWTADQEQSFAVLDAFVAAGGNFVDTADVYSAWAEGNSGGESETVLGQWMAERGNREEIVVATKVGRHPDFPSQEHDVVLAALEASLERLQTDYVDLYYAHFDDEKTPIGDQARTYDELVKSGKVRAIGISNYSPERMREWLDTADAEGLTKPVAIQPHYNLLHRKDYEQDYAKLAEHHGAAVFSYFSLASGLLTGKYSSKEDLKGAAREGMAEGYATEAAFEVVQVLRELAEQHAVEPTTVALAWLLAKGVSAPIASARTVEQLPALMAAPQLRLIQAEVARLDEASAPFAGSSEETEAE